MHENSGKLPFSHPISWLFFKLCMFYMYSGYLHNNINNTNVVVIIFKCTLPLMPLSHELFFQDTDPDHNTKDVKIGVLTVVEDAAVTSLPTVTN